ncbi:MAG: cysteine desulfurase family protein [Cytophagales bacterium]|nr:cysteine desulfurase family protein [Cytophagales bacterium]
MRVYLDNAATTPLDREVVEEMLPFMLEHFGNPSSIHWHGNKVRAAIEQARKRIAATFNTSPSEIFFTSGGTESDNTALRCAIYTYHISHAITSKLEHHAVLHTLEELAQRGIIQLSFVAHDEKGNIDLNHLEELLKKQPNSLVSLMHGNNEIGNLLPIETVGELCRQYGAFFHSDTVQTVGHYRIDLQKINVHSIVGAPHKFHGPKGVGFLYVRHDKKIHPFVTGGAQERNMRGGTENVYGIIGMAKAIEIAYRNLEETTAYIKGLKTYMIERLRQTFEDIHFNGMSGDVENSLYTILNVSFPPSEANDMLLFNLDIHQISASGGSACSSGSNVGSHVLAALPHTAGRGNIRFSFSKYNTRQEIDYTIAKLVEIFHMQHA